MSNKIQISKNTESVVPAIDFARMKEAALGPDYALSLVFEDAKRMKELNLMYRNKSEATDILSFPLSESEGEIYICLTEAQKEMKKFGRDFENFIGFLFIHGCAHLKGYDHGARMEIFEEELRKKFGI